MPAEIIALVAAFSYAAVAVSSRLGLRYSTPFTATCIAFGVRTVLLWIAVFLLGGLPAVAITAVVVFVCLGLLQPATSFLSFLGVAKIGASRSQPLRTTYPVWSAMWSIILLGETLTPGIVGGTMLVVGGTILISWSPDRSATSYRWWHVLYPLGAAFLAGIAFPVRRYGLDISNEPLFFAALLATVSALCLAVSCMSRGTRQRATWDRRALLPFLAAGTFETVASLLSLIAVSMGDVVKVAPLVATSPLWVLLLTVIVLRGVERINLKSVLGTLSVVSGTVTIILVG